MEPLHTVTVTGTPQSSRRSRSPEQEQRGERSSSGSEGSSGYCGSLELVQGREGREPGLLRREGSLQRRPSSSLSSFQPRPASPSTPEPPGWVETQSSDPQTDCPLPDPPSFVENYIEHITAAQVPGPPSSSTPHPQAILRAFPPSPQTQGVLVPPRLVNRPPIH